MVDPANSGVPLQDLVPKNSCRSFLLISLLGGCVDRSLFVQNVHNIVSPIVISPSRAFQAW